MSDPAGGAGSRPRPQYGEYATPEEQRARIQQPDASDALSAGQAPEGAEATASSGAPPTAAAWPTPRAGATAEPSAVPTAVRWRLADRVVTVGLLAYGLVNVVLRVPTLLSFTAFAEEVLQLMGVNDPFTNVASGNLWGAIAATTLMIGWLLAAWWSWWRLRRGRITFWVPIVGAVVTGVLVSVFALIPLSADPAFAALFSRMTTAG